MHACGRAGLLADGQPGGQPGGRACTRSTSLFRSVRTLSAHAPLTCTHACAHAAWWPGDRPGTRTNMGSVFTYTHACVYTSTGGCARGEGADNVLTHACRRRRTVRACMRPYMGAHVQARMRTRVHVYTRMRACACACVCVRMCADACARVVTHLLWWWWCAGARGPGGSLVLLPRPPKVRTSSISDIIL